MHNGFEHLIDPLPRLGAYGNGIGCVQAHSLFDGFLRARNVGGRQVDLVDHGDNLEAVINRQISIGESLRFDALAGIND